MSSKKATIIFGTTALSVAGFIYYIHLDQNDARKKMRQGVINDIQRQKYKENLKKESNSGNSDNNNNSISNSNNQQQ